MRARTDDAVLETMGFKDLRMPGGVVYGLPERVAENETLLNVRLGRRILREHVEHDANNSDDWILTWEQLTKKHAEKVPPQVVAESTSFDGSAGLEDRVRKHWETLPDEEDDPPEIIVTVEYALTGWRSKLLSSKPKKIGQLKAIPSGAYWDVVEANVLIGVSLHESREGFARHRDEERTLVALARVDGGSLDAAACEVQVWQDVSQLLEVST